MSYHGTPRGTTDDLCFPEEAVLRLQPRAAGPYFRELQTLTGRYESWPIDPNRGLLVIDPHYDHLPLGPGWESRTV